MAGGVGMDDAPVRVDEEHAGAETVEGVGECCGFGGLQINHLADKHCTTHMRNDKAHAPAHFVVDHAAGFVSNDAQICTARQRLFEHYVCRIRPALRLCPLLIEASLAKFVVGHEVCNARDLLYIKEDQRDAAYLRDHPRTEHQGRLSRAVG